jgi:hypothetical protein
MGRFALDGKVVCREVAEDEIECAPQPRQSKEKQQVRR